MILRRCFPFALLVGCAPAGPEIDLRRLPVIGGAPDPDDPAVVSIQTVPDAGAPELCTGVIIGPRAILTAGHCTLEQTAGTLTVGVGPSAKLPQRRLVVASVHTYPSYRGLDDAPLGLDLGMVLLGEDARIPPVPLEGDDSASSARLVGFGMTDAADLESRGDKASAPVAVAPTCATLLRIGDVSANACHGDSGAPILFRDARGVERVGALVSFGTRTCVPPSYAVRVAPYAPWIAEVVAGGAGTECGAGGCVDPPRSCIADGAAPPDAGLAAHHGGGCAAAPVGAAR